MVCCRVQTECIFYSTKSIQNETVCCTGCTLTICGPYIAIKLIVMRVMFTDRGLYGVVRDCYKLIEYNLAISQNFKVPR